MTFRAVGEQEFVFVQLLICYVNYDDCLGGTFYRQNGNTLIVVLLPCWDTPQKWELEILIPRLQNMRHSRFFAECPLDDTTKTHL